MFDGVLSDYKLTPILFSRHFKKRTSMTWNWSLVSESDVRYFPSKSGFRYIYRWGFYHKTNTTSLFLQSSSPVAMVWKLTCQICFLTTTLARLAWAKCILTKIKTIFPKSAFVAQWLEHWSCKPGVKSSNLFEGWRLPIFFFVTYFFISFLQGLATQHFSRQNFAKMKSLQKSTFRHPHTVLAVLGKHNFMKALKH